MTETDILNRIKSLMKEKKLSENALSKKCNLPQSTVNSLFIKNNAPTLSTLIKICDGLGLTITQFFMTDEDEGISLTEDQKRLFSYWDALNASSQNVLMDTAISLKRNQEG